MKSFSNRAIISIYGALVLTLAASGSVAADPAAEQAIQAQLTVVVKDLRNGNGGLRLGVFRDGKGFPRISDNAVVWRSRPGNAADRQFVVDLPPGDYAVVVLHDENGNKKLDTNFFGIPTEGHGVTNNPKPLRRGPRYDEAKFTLPREGAEVIVSIQYKYF